MPLTDRDRRTLRIGGIIAGVLIAGILAMNQFAGGQDEVPIPPAAQPDVTETPELSPTTSPAQIPPAPVFTGRDPFSVPAGFSSSGATSTSSGSTSSGSTSSGSTSSGSTSSGSTSSGSTANTGGIPGDGSSAVVGGHDVVLLDVFTMSGIGAVQVEIDGQIYNVTVGETFGPGGNFELRSTSGYCASFRYGDESFTLCVSPDK